MREDEIPMELKNKKINFLGDSITEGVGSCAFGAENCLFLKEYLIILTGEKNDL